MAKGSTAKKGSTVTNTAPTAPAAPAAPVTLPALDDNGRAWLAYVGQTNEAGSFASIEKAVADALGGYLDVNYSAPDAEGKFPAMLSDAGRAALAPAAAPAPVAPAAPAPAPAPAPAAAAAPSAAPTPAAEAPKQTRTIIPPPEGGFEIATGLAVPAAIGGGRGKRSFMPFDSIPVGGAFFVPVDEKRNLSVLMKSVSSSASTATDRSKKNTPNDLRFFACRKLLDGHAAGFSEKWKGVQGVGVYRVASAG
jgi:hypothetical protein